jgi:hypothetical protein
MRTCAYSGADELGPAGAAPLRISQRRVRCPSVGSGWIPALRRHPLVATIAGHKRVVSVSLLTFKLGWLSLSAKRLRLARLRQREAGDRRFQSDLRLA